MNGGRSTAHNRRGTIPRIRPEGPLRALQLIETVGDVEPFEIHPVSQRSGSVVSAGESMTARVKWANRAQYTVLTRNVPKRFAPYNAVIRVIGTEDYRVDYLAQLDD